MNLGGGSLGSQTVTFSGKVDAIAEHVTSNTDTSNSFTTSTAAYRQFTTYGGHDLGSVTAVDEDQHTVSPTNGPSNCELDFSYT